MTPDQRAAVNRANARASTGPRTAAGKAKVAGNARRHGLWVAGWGLDSAEARDLARRLMQGLEQGLAGAQAPPMVEAAAMDVAYAVLELRKVRRHRGALLEAALDGGETEALVGDLVRLDRYERRARTHRRNAIRALDTARGAGQ